MIFHGPALRYTRRELVSDNTYSIEVDNVFAIRCREWPKEAERWSTRQRSSGWPSNQLIQRVIADGCHVVPISHCKSRNPDIDWRYSFSVAERTLAQSLTDSQRQCYVLLKTIVMHELSRPDVLCSYHLKPLLFWQCEKIPESEWSTDIGLAASLLCLLDELMHCVATQYLPNYFIPECNLFDHVHPDFLTDVARKLSHIRHEPLYHVLDFNKRCQFSFTEWYFYQPGHHQRMQIGILADVFSDVIEDATLCHDSMRKRYEQQQHAFWTQGKQYLNEKRDMNALFAFKQLANVTRRQTGGDCAVLALVTCAALEMDITHAIVQLECIVEKLNKIEKPNRDCDESSYVLSNLACMYHAVAFSDARKHEMLEKAEGNFLKAMSDTSMNDATIKVDYSLFLVHFHRNDEATDLLKQIISSECKYPVSSNMYRSNMKNITEDANLLKEMNHQGGIRTASHAFAYYVLATIYCDTDRQTDAETLLPDFQCLCSNILSRAVDVTMCARAFSLLGYTYLAVNNYSMARQAFDNAAHLVDGYTLAVVKCNLCDTLRLCTQQLSTLESQGVNDTEATLYKEVASRNTGSGSREAPNQQPASHDPVADTPTENTENRNMSPLSVTTDSTYEITDYGESQSIAPDSLGVDFHDWTAGVSLLQLSFVLDQFLPQRHVRHSIATASSERIDAMLSCHCANLHDITLEPVAVSTISSKRPRFSTCRAKALLVSTSCILALIWWLCMCISPLKEKAVKLTTALV